MTTTKLFMHMTKVLYQARLKITASVRLPPPCSTTVLIIALAHFSLTEQRSGRAASHLI